MADLQHTHEAVYDGDVVIKRYVDGKPGGAEREWRALNLLAEHAPGLAPEPIAFEAGVVSMTRIDGVPMRGGIVRAAHAAALVEAVARLHTAVPRPVLETVPARPWQREEACDWIRLRGRAGGRGTRWRTGP